MLTAAGCHAEMNDAPFVIKNIWTEKRKKRKKDRKKREKADVIGNVLHILSRRHL